MPAGEKNLVVESIHCKSLFADNPPQLTTGGTINRALQVNGTLGATGDFNVATDKFTVAATSGNIEAKGNLKLLLGTDEKFKVQAADGVLESQGNLILKNSTTERFKVIAASGNLESKGDLKLTNAAASVTNFEVTASNGNLVSKGDLALTNAGAIEKFKVQATDGNLVSQGGLTLKNGADEKFKVTAGDGNTTIEGTLDVTGEASFTAAVGLGVSHNATSPLKPAVTGDPGADIPAAPYLTVITKADSEAAGDHFLLANGTKAGQKKLILKKRVVTGESMIVKSEATKSNFGSGGLAITACGGATDDRYIECVWDGTKWLLIAAKLS